jgi:DNA-binding LytR/AlgR family response regulator
MLWAGGNAVDAAIAAAAAMTIVEPVSNGLGSDAFCILWDGKELHGLNASGRAPQGWTPEYFHQRYGRQDKPPRRGVDYLLKPVQPERLARSVQRLRELLAQRTAAPAGAALAQALEQLRHLAGATAPAGTEPPLQMIQAGVGTQIQMVPVQDIVYFEAADKYVRVLTAAREYLVRTPLKELLPRLDPEVFWQVHRGTVVRSSAIASAQRDEAGRLWLQLRERPERLAVSRLYAQRFKAM